MKLEPPRMKIGDTDGFANTDLFGYSDFSERFAKILEDVDSAPVIMLDGPWGSGKSTFVQQWAGLLRERGHAVCYFDAFANDHQDDAFFALAGELYSLAEHEESLDCDFRSSFATRAANLGKALWPLTARFALKTVTQGIVSMDDARKIKAAVTESPGEFITLLKERITGVQKERRLLEQFRSLLSELAQRLTTPASETVSTDTSKDFHHKLVFIVDELDRCKPTFALNLIERIKHVFSAKNVCFVLVAHVPQLAEVVQRSYGVTDGKLYLEKFYQLRVTLPAEIDDYHAGPYVRYLDFLLKAMDVRTDDARNLELTVNALKRLSAAYGLSLRSLERITLNVSLAYLATNGTSLRFPPIIAGLCIMRVVNHELYGSAKLGNLRSTDALEFMRFERWNAGGPQPANVEWYRRIWTYATATDDELRNGDWPQIEQAFYQSGIEERRALIPLLCKAIDEFGQDA